MRRRPGHFGGHNETPKWLFLVGVLTAAAATVTATASAGPSGAATQPARLEHFKCYTFEATSTHKSTSVGLHDQFQGGPGTGPSDVSARAHRLCNPVQKTDADGTISQIVNPQAHLVCYRIHKDDSTREVVVQNQFGRANLTVFKPHSLCVPSWKQFNAEFPEGNGNEAPPGLDYFQCYRAHYSNPHGARFNTPRLVALMDQFEDVPAAVGNPVELCNPTEILLSGGYHSSVNNPAAHLVCFPIHQETPHQPVRVIVKNRFQLTSGETVSETRLCLPSFKQEINAD